MTPSTQVPVAGSHRSPDAQSVSPAHWFLHDVPAQTYGAQSFVTGVGQSPIPSQVAGRVATSFVQLACVHVTDEPT